MKKLKVKKHALEALSNFIAKAKIEQIRGLLPSMIQGLTNQIDSGTFAIFSKTLICLKTVANVNLTSIDHGKRSL